MAEPAAVVPQQPLQPMVAPPRQAPTSSPRPAYATTAAHFSPGGVLAAKDDGFLGGRITPMQLGMLLSLVAFVIVIAGGGPGNAQMDAPAALPAATGVAAPGSSDATLPMKGRPLGMPSPAAGAALKAEQAARRAQRNGGGGAAIPDTETLPLRAPDGMSLPAGSGDRDAHASEAHYRDTLPLERPVARPAITPGESAAAAEEQAVDVTPTDSGSSGPSNPNAPF